MKSISISEHFTFKKILRISFAPICMMIFSSLYGIVDGFCVSNFSGPDAFAGLNLIFPAVMIIGGVGFMFGTGGSALTAKFLGEKKQEEANQSFSNVLSFATFIGLILSISGIFLVKPIVYAMASVTSDVNDETLRLAILYGRILMGGQFLFILQNLFQSYLIVDEKPRLGFLFILGAGCTNIVLDLLFIGVFKWGVVGAAAATIIGYIVGGGGPLIYFLTHKNDPIRLKKSKLNFKFLGQSAFNGLSEFVNNIASSIVSVLFNIQLLKYFGQNGVSAYGTLMYLGFVFAAIFIGLSVGTAPIISYNYGAQNHEEMKNVLRINMLIIGIFAICMVSIGESLAPVLSKIFSSGSTELQQLSEHALRIYVLCFLFAGVSIYLSSFFTALNNGLISAIISVVRCLVLESSFVFIIPLIMGKEGIWWSIVFSDIGSIILSLSFLFGYRKKYQYM